MKKTPKLRFPEFSGEWEEKKLGTLLEFKNGINASKEQYGKGVKFINVLDILSNNYIKYDNIIGKVDIDESTLEKYSVSYGDVIFQRSSETREEVGTANVYLDKEKKATFGGFVIRGKKIGEYDPVFINKLLKTPLARKDITTKSGGSTRYNVSQEILSDVELLFPSILEQEKIASFFSLIDEKVEKQQKKVEALEVYKKGMLQKIFSREIRFKKENGEEYPEWELLKLGDLGSTYTGLSGKTKENFGKGEAKYITYLNVFNNIIANVKMVDLVEVDEKENQNKVKKSDLFFTTSSETPEEVGMISTWNGEEENIYLNSFCFGYRIYDRNKVNNNFLAYLLRSKEYRKQITILAQGSTRYNISKNALMDMVIEIPCFDEQINMADFISLLERKVEYEYEKLSRLSEFKKGLLQQMFV